MLLVLLDGGVCRESIFNFATRADGMHQLGLLIRKLTTMQIGEELKDDISTGDSTDRKQEVARGLCQSGGGPVGRLTSSLSMPLMSGRE